MAAVCIKCEILQQRVTGVRWAHTQRNLFRLAARRVPTLLPAAPRHNPQLAAYSYPATANSHVAQHSQPELEPAPLSGKTPPPTNRVWEKLKKRQFKAIIANTSYLKY